MHQHVVEGANREGVVRGGPGPQGPDAEGLKSIDDHGNLYSTQYSKILPRAATFN
jgi:hypothetical protein